MFADKVNFIHPLFDNESINPELVIPHPQAKLYDMWKYIQNYGKNNIINYVKTILELY